MNSSRIPAFKKLASSVDALAHSSLNSFAQIYCQRSAWFGAILLLALCVSGAALAMAGCMGLAIANLCAVLLRAPRADIRNGVYGYNAALCGVGLAAVYHAGAGLLLWIGAAAVFCALATHLFLRWGGLPVLTLPFILGTLLVAQLGPATGLLLQPGEGGGGPAPFFAFHALAQVCFIDSPALGALILAALAFHRRHSAMWVLTAALIAWGAGSAAAGVWSAAIPGPYMTGMALNCMLTAICLTAHRHKPSVLLSGILATALLGLAAAALDLRLLTLPFVVASWAALKAAELSRKMSASTAERGAQGT